MRTLPRRPGRWTALALAPLVALGLGGFLLTGAFAGGPAAVAQADDPDEQAIELALSRRLFEDNCLMCHAEEMTTGQRLTPTQWTAEVEKMIGWGAPVPPEEKGRLIDYLAAHYPADLPREPPPRVEATMALSFNRQALTTIPDQAPGDPDRGAMLYASNCANCHGPTGLGGDLGTNLVEKPVLLSPDDYTAVVRDGRRRMPGFKAVLNHDQEADILAWLRGRTYGAD